MHELLFFLLLHLSPLYLIMNNVLARIGKMSTRIKIIVAVSVIIILSLIFISVSEKDDPKDTGPKYRKEIISISVLPTLDDRNESKPGLLYLEPFRLADNFSPERINITFSMPEFEASVMVYEYVFSASGGEDNHTLRSLTLGNGSSGEFAGRDFSCTSHVNYTYEAVISMTEFNGTVITESFGGTFCINLDRGSKYAVIHREPENYNSATPFGLGIANLRIEIIADFVDEAVSDGSI